jgi:sugar phosphate isomerase/epimerase
MVPVSIQIWSVREACEKDFFGTLRQLAGIGYAGVEIGPMFGRKPAEVRKVMDDLGMTVPSLLTGLPTKENAAGIAETAKALGCDTAVFGAEQEHYKTADAVKALADQLYAGAEQLGACGVKLAYHNHWWEFEPVEGRYGHDRLLELCPNILCEIDVYWASHFGEVDVPAQIAAKKKIIPFLHLKDGTWVKDEPHVAVGMGKMDIPACVAAADPKVLRGVIVELDECATDMMTAVRQSYQYLTKNGLGKGRK